MSVDETTIVAYIVNELKNPDLALCFATRNNLAGAEELAAQVAATPPEVSKLLQSANSLLVLTIPPPA